jgi:hypothetical protein
MLPSALLKTVFGVRCEYRVAGKESAEAEGSGGKHVPPMDWRRGSSAVGLHIDGREVIRIFVLDETFR